jgi:rfaE bifunctional protein nucleotidyltransferase chain/domain
MARTYHPVGAFTRKPGGGTKSRRHKRFQLQIEKGHGPVRQKVLTAAALRRRLTTLRRQRKRIVFTNGCFDLIHPGHVRYLRAARRLGDVLVVGLNSDASVRRLKGPTRPLVPLRDRREVLAALEMVDFVTTFSDDTPYKLIQQVQPDVLVKGGDWTPERIVGADIVRARGGRVCSVPFASGHSTTALAARIRERSSVRHRRSKGKRRQIEARALPDG